MLDQTTKRQIDSARQILVGKVPDPKAQVEQITTAMIYKFMDDMDRENEDIGLKAQFFVDEYTKYSWRKLMDNRLSGQERMDLYVEAVANIPKNGNIPQLFRDIFKGAFLPFRDPRTLSLFLKEINEFSYENSENLGNSFEYLLSILGSQGDAGQFRTPRHIIDFIVEVVDPKKNETILDPACGTAGFLISAYKHIIKTNSSNFNPAEEKLENKITQGETATETIISDKVNYTGDLMSPEDKTKLTQNIVGYDISPDMVKLALVNLYLHGFTNPKIAEYDTLTSDKRWDEIFDVVMANPPFMTPTGGITPHNRFAIQSRKAEALFVDYIIEHLSIKGKAGIVIPEGILENISKDFNAIRKSLIENGLYAVVSLPVGTFNPYSGTIKTSILFIDKNVKDKNNKIIRIQIDNDGYDLGKNRKSIANSQLPIALKSIKSFHNSLLSKTEFKLENDNEIFFEKEQIINNEGYSLNIKSYIKNNNYTHKNLIEIGKLFNIEKGSLQSTKNKEGDFSFITASGEWKTHFEYTHDCEAIIYAMGASGSLGRTHYVNGKFIASDLCFILTPHENYKNKINLKFYNDFFVFMRDQLVIDLARGAAKKAINQRNFSKYKIPYLEYKDQETIMDIVETLKREIEKESKIIDEHQKIIDEKKDLIKSYILNER
jgi:type I restriction enzyme M protein